MATLFSDYFGIDKDTLEEYGAFNISVVNDLPLLIDPFLIFNSEKTNTVSFMMISFFISYFSEIGRFPVRYQRALLDFGIAFLK